MSAKSYDTIKYEVDGHTATITLNRPDALNALSPHMITELRAAYDEAENDDNVWILIVTGTGRAFCTGADVSEIPERRQGRQRAALPVHLRAVGGAAGGHAAVSAGWPSRCSRRSTDLLRRRPGLGDHRRHRHRVRQGHVLRSARQHRAGGRPRDGAPGPRAAAQRRAADGVDGQARADERPARLRPRA